jgi:hypothetical protein
MGSPIYVDEWKLREIFNSAILPRIEAKELLESIVTDRPASPKYGQGSGARSQMVAYFEVVNGKMGSKVAEAHRYLLPDGTLGGSGKHLPDPKSLIHEGKLYVLDRKAGGKTQR